jgi:hypothetical protein
VDAIHSMILEDQRISAKNDSRDPGDIPRKSRIHYSQDVKHVKLSAKRVPES